MDLVLDGGKFLQSVQFVMELREHAVGGVHSKQVLHMVRNQKGTKSCAASKVEHGGILDMVSAGGGLELFDDDVAGSLSDLLDLGLVVVGLGGLVKVADVLILDRHADDDDGCGWTVGVFFFLGMSCC